MKKTIKTITTVIAGVALTLGLSLTSCKKAETGPAGAVGATGAQGPAGNANVYNYKFNINLSTFTGPLSNGEWASVFNPTTVMGSTFIDEKDAVLLYLFDHTTGTTDYYNQMPFVDYFNTGTAFNSHSFEVGSTGTANILTIKIRNSTGGQPYGSMTTGALSYKMVVIKAFQKVKPQLPTDLSYEAVKKYYDLKD
jgi:hypothetical protein